MFEPQLSASWVGNLKKYKFSGPDQSLKNKKDKPAIDPETGEFIATSTSYWSEASDGDDILSGGAAGRLRLDTRRIVSNLDDTTESLLTSTQEFNTNEINESNRYLTADMLGLAEAPVATSAGEVCFCSNEDWSYAGTRGANFRVCAGVRGQTDFGAAKGHNDSISAVSVGTGVHTILYNGTQGKGGIDVYFIRYR